MISKSYYCLVSGLPDLMIGDSKLPVSISEFRDLLSEELSQGDFNLVKLLLLPFDHLNIINSLFENENKEFDKKGNFPKDIIENLTDKKELELGIDYDVPVYIIKCIKEVVFSENDVDEVSAEMLFTNEYYNVLNQSSNKFIRSYGNFDQQIRNIVAALNGRKFSINMDDQLIGNNEITEALKKNRANDFGLSVDVEIMDQLLQIYETSDILERELKLDKMRWAFIEEKIFFEYFSIDRILAFVIKLMIVERWFALDVERGRELFKKLLHELESGYEFPEEYKLNYGKKK